MIVGTAGHIDHGKTTLVRALTGIDTDRLKEEKARGISIELGYAYTPLASGGVLGFVDVPGHERLVHTMVAGACGIDFALLVVAADDGVMPQTREHIAILELLGVSRGAVALTKIDRVEPARLRAAEAQVRDALACSALSAAPFFALDATAAADAGVEALRAHLHTLAERTATRAADGLFRLAVDRVFSLAGLGTTATGTVFSGRVHLGETVAVMPAGRTVRVRSIHAQNRAADVGRAGERCALALVGVEKSALKRGDWLADARALAASTRLDVRLRLLPECGTSLRPWSPLHVHLGTAHRVAHVALLDVATLSAGDSGYVQLVFEAPVCAAPGDRFIVRDAQGRRTLGGGRVLDPCAPARRRRTRARAACLVALERMIGGEGMAPLLEHAVYGMRMAELVRLTGAPANSVALPAEARVIEACGEMFVLPAARWQALGTELLQALARFHAEVPEEPGPDAGRLRRISHPDMPLALWRALVEALAAERRLHVNGPWLQLPGHTASLSADDEALLGRLQPLIAAGGFDPPWVRELALAVREPEPRVRAVLRKQLAQGGAFQVVRDLFYDRGRVAELAAIAAACTREPDGLNAARFRDRIGLGRKRAIQILEFFDRVGYTRRVRDSHVLRPDSPWAAARGSGAAGSAAGAPTAGASDATAAPGGAALE
jgi:selenocysteine-specific elongation factor